ncbi:DUF1540 domain-containing protein [Anaerotignum sp.]|uniref:DUF1540 domain-containing protein n=1 Tax=Anaerotignum sp. TaxID=2039241 RepID=UPI00331AE016
MTKSNSSIRCSVHDCKHNCAEKDCCSLDTIQIRAHNANPKSSTSVDCCSFDCKCK